MILSCKYKLKPTNSQIKIFEEWLNTCRFVYNAALTERVEAYKVKKISISKFQQYNELPEIKKELTFVKNVHSDVLQQTLDRVDLSYQSFFRGNGFPKFKKKKFYTSFTFKRGVKMTDNYITLPKIGKVKFHNSKNIKNVKTASIIKENNKWFISVTYEIQEKPLAIDITKSVGIDAGIVYHSILSDETYINSSKSLEKNLPKLRILNRELSRKVRYSKSWYKTTQKLNKLHLKVKNERKDFNHKLSTKIVKEYSAIFIEDLQIFNMVKLNSTLSRRILDNGFYQFRLLLEYKCKIVGKTFKAIPPHYTSQKCSSCGITDKKSRINQSEYVCTNCGLIINADFNAAKNIKVKGISFLAQSKPLG